MEVMRRRPPWVSGRHRRQVGYIAQHAFHHIEQHMDKTPNEYVQWRCAQGSVASSFQR
jgi:hypothetical protein